MRSTGDRIRHAVSFELIALFIVTPAGALAFDEPLQDMGAVVVISATIATCWNYVYNLIFDHALLRLKGSVRKTLATRIVHALLFEGGLLLVLLPVIAWYLGIGLVKAFLMDVTFAASYLVYAFVFNWAYDIVFPVPAAERGGRRTRSRQPLPSLADFPAAVGQTAPTAETALHPSGERGCKTGASVQNPFRHQIIERTEVDRRNLSGDNSSR